jgi:hypothetical protein
MYRRNLFATLVLLLPAALAAPAQNAPATSACARFCGVWRGQADNLPAVTLVLTGEGGALNGAVLFYLHMRKTVNDPMTSTPSLPEPIFHLQVEGNKLTFQVSHRHANPPRSLSDPPITLALTVTGNGTAQIENVTENGPSLTLTRSDQ